MQNIPEEFKERMKWMIKEEYHSFLQTYQYPAYHALRINTLKVPVDQFLKRTSFTLEQVPWCPTGFYLTEQERPGKHPYHAAGVYYIQEPSAMAIVEYLSPKPGEHILDLCAAPGGKSTQIAASLRNKGWLLANEIIPARAKTLSENMERMGVKNAIVTNESPEQLAKRFPHFFDRILVDAPCSGEGMFRKLDEACSDWSPGKVVQCAALQREILVHAAQMLQPGGTLVYSTCTFSPEENEGIIAWFLSAFPEFELAELTHTHGISAANPEWGERNADLKRAARLWPHHLKGEGHFTAKLIKKGEKSTAQPRAKQTAAKADKAAMAYFDQFCKESLHVSSAAFAQGDYISFGDNLYLLPMNAPDLNKMKVIRPGWHLGTIKKGRFEPSHSFALGLTPAMAKQFISFPPTSDEIIRYLRGESLLLKSELKGWVLVCVDEYTIGWAKASDGQLKNHYPKGLRWV